MLQCTAIKMAYLTLEVFIFSDLNNVLSNLVIIVWSATENGKKLLTLRSQQERVEAQEVCAEVEPALARYFAFPVAAWIICDQLFLRRQLKPLLKPQECFSELFRIIL